MLSIQGSCRLQQLLEVHLRAYVVRHLELRLEVQVLGFLLTEGHSRLLLGRQDNVGQYLLGASRALVRAKLSREHEEAVVAHDVRAGKQLYKLTA